MPRLEAASLRVCIDFREFAPGISSFANMERAVAASERTLLVLTPAWVESEWSDFESLLAGRGDPAGRRGKLIPLMLEKCEPPTRIKLLTYVDFTRPDREEIAWRQLLTALGAPLAVQLAEKAGNKDNGAIALAALSSAIYYPLGELRKAEATLRHQIELSREIEEEFIEAVGHQELGLLLAYRGVWGEAAEELATALELFEKHQAIQSQGEVWAYRAQRALLLDRAATTTSGRLPQSNDPLVEALTAARRALELANETARTNYPVERDCVRVYWLLGAAHRANGHLDEADRHQTKALTRCRGINLVEVEADILLELARLRAAQGEKEEALQLAQEALLITERSEYVLQGADVNLFLAEMALEDGDREKALGYARQAR